METKTLWGVIAAVAASAALLVHVIVPLVHWEDADRDAYLYPSEVADIVGDSVTGTGPGYMLAGVIILTLGGLMVVAARPVGARLTPWLLGIGGTTTTIGGAMTLHANGLWTGRGMSTLMHTILGTDTPSPELADISASAADYPVAVWAVSAPIVLLLAGLAVFACWRTWAFEVTEQRGLRDMARRHARVGFYAMLTLSIALVVPWSMQTLEDSTTPPEGQAQDEDAFIWSAYDALRIHQETTAEAQDTREGGLIQYEGLSFLLGAVIAAGFAAIIGAGLAVGGTHVATSGQVVWGRLLENTAFLTVLAIGFLGVAAFLGTFWLYDSGDLLDSSIIGGPLLILLGAVPGLWAGSVLIRELVQEDSDPVADDFPEPVVYD